ncbi:MAG: hypothetical protein ACQETH_02735 [Candidatus Rifleibacteriota bacterium]
MSVDNKIFLTEAKQKSGNAISPIFGLIMIAFAFVGTYAISSINDDLGIAEKLTFSTIMAVMIYIPGIFLFQRFAFVVTNKEVRWETAIIPGIWVQKWKEPVSNYRGIFLQRTKPVIGFLYPRFCPYNAVFPKKIQSESISESDKKFNASNFVVITLKHKFDSNKDLALKSFPGTSQNDINAFCESARKQLGLERLN